MKVAWTVAALAFLALPAQGLDPHAAMGPAGNVPATTLDIPVQAGPLACAPGSTVVPVGPWTASVAANATLVQAVFAPSGSGYAAFAVAAGASVHALLMMQERHVALLELGAFAWGGAAPANTLREFRAGLLGVPEGTARAVDATGAAGAMDSMGPMMDYEAGGTAQPCRGSQGELGIRFPRPEPTAGAAGVQAWLLGDPSVPGFLPHPLAGSTVAVPLSLRFGPPGTTAGAFRAAPGPPWPEEAGAFLAVALVRRSGALRPAASAAARSPSSRTPGPPASPGRPASRRSGGR